MARRVALEGWKVGRSQEDSTLVQVSIFSQSVYFLSIKIIRSWDKKERVLLFAASLSKLRILLALNVEDIFSESDVSHLLHFESDARISR